jgi:hypothetical protein
MRSHRAWLVAALIPLAAPAAGAAPPVPTVPAQYQDLYDELSADITAFQQTDRCSINWLAVNTTGYAPGPHTVTAVARDRAGNQGVSAPVAIVTGNR